MSIIDDEEEIIIEGVNVAECFCPFDVDIAREIFKKLDDRIKRLKAENEELKEKVKLLDSMTGIFSARQAKKYHQALEAIRKELLQKSCANSQAITNVLVIIDEVLD